MGDCEMRKLGKREKLEKEKLEKQKERCYKELRDKGRISARIIDVKAGLRVIEGVYAVRIHSVGYTALIMNDYIPALGKIDGDVSFLSRDVDYVYPNIRGFYKHQHNVFTLLVEEHGNGEQDGENVEIHVVGSKNDGEDDA